MFQQPHHRPTLEVRKLRHRGLQIVVLGLKPCPTPKVNRIVGPQRCPCPNPQDLFM